MTRLLCLAVMTTSALTVALPVRAADPQPDRTPAAFWSEASEPGAQRARALLQQAEQELVAATVAFPVGWEMACKKLSSLAAPLDLPGFAHKRTRVMATVLNESMQRLTHIENAIARLQIAERLAPDQPDILYALGLALREWERPGPLWSCHAERRDADAINVLERLHRRHPSYRPSTIAFDLAILHTRKLQFQRAADYYAEGAPLELNTSQMGILYSNWAEVTMLAGDLVAAVHLYQRAINVTSRGREYLLPLWGLAVALDRLGERDSALEQATRAVQAEGGSMSVLHSDGVFFEPESEIHYYEALGHEAQALIPQANVDAALEQAAQSWRAFFAAGGDSTPWAASARDNLQRIEAELARRKAATATTATPARKQQPRLRSRR